MALPTTKDIELPLLREIEAMGGEARPQALYPRVTAHFPQITEADLQETIARGINKWTNRIQWTRQHLVLKGQLERYPRGVWRITDQGKKRLGTERVAPLLPPHPSPASPRRHDELKQVMVEIGKKLGYHTSTEEGPEYRHDVLWRRTPYKTPSHVIEICDGGSLPKDFASLNWANQNWDARGVLIVTDGKDFEKATRQLSYHSGITVVKAESVDHLHELVMTDLELLKSIFSEQL